MTAPPRDLARRVEWSERQMERGQFFVHTALGVLHHRLREVELMLHGLLDALLSRGLVTDTELRRACELVAPALDADQPLNVGVVVGNESAPVGAEASAEEQPEEETVDCAARMHVCHAVCCRLDFALTVPEIEAGEVKWDLGRPYLIRHEADGGCTHHERETGRCGIYEKRPSVCRRYSCRHDERIWTDFERMELNTEWISEHVPPAEDRPRPVFLPFPEVPERGHADMSTEIGEKS